MKVKLFFFLTYKVMGLYGIICEETNAFSNEQTLAGSSIKRAGHKRSYSAVLCNFRKD